MARRQVPDGGFLDQRRLDDARSWGRQNLATNDLHYAITLPPTSSMLVLNNEELEADAKPRQLTISGLFRSVAPSGIMEFIQTASGLGPGLIQPPGGTVFMEDTGVIPGNYEGQSSTFTVNSRGQITLVSGGGSGVLDSETFSALVTPTTPSGILIGGLIEFGYVPGRCSFYNAASGAITNYDFELSQVNGNASVDSYVSKTKPRGNTVGEIDVLISGDVYYLLLSLPSGITSNSEVTGRIDRFGLGFST